MDSIILILTIVIISIVLFYKWNQMRVRKYREKLIDTYKFPHKLKEEVLKKYPHLTNEQTDSVINALRQYFHICNDADKNFVSMPSQVVDVAWHEFILFTQAYENFCKKALGRFLHHTPAEAMSKPNLAQDGIKRAWKLSCIRENINPKSATRLPTLFAIDALFKIEDGFKYSLNCTTKNSNDYCAGHIGCGAGGCGGGFDSSDGGSSCGSGCGGGCGGS